MSTASAPVLPPEAVARRRRIAGAAMIAAPLVMLVADSIGLAFGDVGFWAWSVALWVSFLLFVPAVVGMSAAAAGSADRLGLAGAGLALIGLMTGATIMGVHRTAHVLSGAVGEAEMAAAPGAKLLLATSIQPGLTFPIGLLILTLALRRAGALSGPMAAVLAAGAILFPVGRIFVGFAGSVASDVCLALALVPLGLSLRSAASPPA